MPQSLQDLGAFSKRFLEIESDAMSFLGARMGSYWELWEPTTGMEQY